MNIKSVYDHEVYKGFIKWRLTDYCNYSCEYCVRRKRYDRGIGWHQDTELRDEDWQKDVQAVPYVNRILNEFNGPVKIDFIGGEVTTLPLIELLKLLDSPNLRHFNITTNFSKDIDFYKELIDYSFSRDIKVGLVVSFHYQFNQVDTFLQKICDLQEYAKDRGTLTISAEMPCTCKNIEQAIAFSEACDKLNIPYKIERDIRVTPADQLNLFAKSTIDHIRYNVTYTDGSTEQIITRNDLLTRNDLNTNGCSIATKGYYCTRDVNYVLIEHNVHYGFTATSNTCACKEPIEDFHILSEPRICTRERCSLCGRMSIDKNKDDLINNVLK